LVHLLYQWDYPDCGAARDYSLLWQWGHFIAEIFVNKIIVNNDIYRNRFV